MSYKILGKRKTLIGLDVILHIKIGTYWSLVKVSARAIQASKTVTRSDKTSKMFQATLGFPDV
jgi:hypothetical protein